MNGWQLALTGSVAIVNALVLWVLSDIRDRVRRLEDHFFDLSDGERRRVAR